MPLPINRYPGLDGIRAVASLAVVGTHAAYWTGNYKPDTAGLLLARLDFGVALFFVLSGFLLFRPWVLSAWHGSQDGPSVKRFFWHRALRILPAYWVVVLFAFAFAPTVPGAGEGGTALLRNLTLTQIYGSGLMRTDLTQMWSLATEVAFYLLLPVFGWAVLRLRGSARALLYCAGLAVLTVVWYALTRTVIVLDASSVFWLPAFLDWFAGGMALSVLVVWWEQDRDRAPAALRAVVASPGSCWVVAACLIAIASTPIAGGATLGQSLTKNLLYLGAGLALVAPCVLRPELTPGTRWVAGPVMRWLGLISYEIFLVHLLVLDGVMRMLDYQVFTGSLLKVFVLTAGLSVPLAWGLFRLVERPARRLRDRVGGPRSVPQPRRS